MSDTSATERPWSAFGIIFVCFFLSGATGLVYQVLWLRMLGLVFGHTVYAITAVLAAFMAGLALGSFLFGRIVGRLPNLVRTYGWLEIGIGVYCALLPALLWLASFLYLGLHRTLGLSYDAFSFVQFLLVFVLLLVPTTLMGGTLPVLSQAFVREETGLGRMVGTLYAVNTLGAVVGTVLAGYVLLPAFGNLVTVGIAAAGNLLVGILAILYSRRSLARSGAAMPAESAGPDDRGAHRRAPRPAAPEGIGLGAWLCVIGLGVSGAVSLVYEVAWTRALALVIGSSTYAFTSMLVAFLVGIAGGSALYSWLWGARRASPVAFGVIQAGIAISFAVTLFFFERMPELFLAALARSYSPAFVQLSQFLLSAAVLLAGTLFIGATFPCAVAVVARSASRIGYDVGRIYAVNTLGAIAGAVLAGFVLIPAVGVHTTIKLGLCVNLLLAAVFFAVAGPRPVVRFGGLALLLAASAGALFIPTWDLRVLSSGPAVYAKSYLNSRMTVPDILRAQKLLFYRDGVSGTISVNQEGNHIFLRTNGKMDAGTAVDMPTQLMSGHLPMLFARDPRSVLVIGMGSGITVGAVSRHPVERVDIVEIEPAVVEASRFFAHVHGDVLRDPRVRVVIADGRNYLLTTPERYDVIISEPSNPWIGGLASLFSVEFFRHARDRLRPGGLMLQWIQGYSIEPEDLQMVVRTFRTVFPHASVWNTITGDYLVIGRTEPLAIDLPTVRARYEQNPAVWRELERIGIQGWPGVLSYFLLGEADTARFSAGQELNTDDRLPLEFSAPRALYLDTASRNWQIARRFQTERLPLTTPESRADLERPEVHHGIGLGHLARQVPEEALPHFERAFQIDPTHAPSILQAAAIHVRAGRFARGLDLVRGLLDREPRNAQALYVAGVASEGLGVADQAMAYLHRAVALQPDNSDFMVALRRVGGGARLGR